MKHLSERQLEILRLCCEEPHSVLMVAATLRVTQATARNNLIVIQRYNLLDETLDYKPRERPTTLYSCNERTHNVLRMYAELETLLTKN